MIYIHMFPHRELLLRYNDQGVPEWEDRALRMGLPLAKRLISRVLEISPGVEVQDEAVVWAELDAVAELLEDGRPYLCGERFTAADLTFAALCAPLLMPPEYGVELPRPGVLPAPTAALVQRAREHPAGAHALRMYAEQRRPGVHRERAAAAQ
jgi:glutathione S-transferase